MSISDDLGNIDTLARQLAATATKNLNEGMTPREIITAFLYSIGNTLAAIQCPDCRAHAARWVELELPNIVREAMQKAGERFGEQPSGHLH